MLDFDLAELYKVETRVLNQSVKRNIKRFPENFMFQLTAKEWESMSSQFVMTYPYKRPRKALPFAFTEHGVTMLASVLNSDHAIKMNIAIVNAFVALRQYALNYAGLVKKIEEIGQRVDNHGEQLQLIYEAIENMLDEKAEMESRKRRNPVGFKISGAKKKKKN
jgi:hypothetical protein